MLFAGFNVFQGHLTLIGMIIAGIVGDTVGATIAYVIGYRASEALMDTRTRSCTSAPVRIQRAHRWFERYGAPVIVVSRLIPLGRAAFPYAAGVAEMQFAKFITFAVIGSVVWIDRARAAGARGRPRLAELAQPPRVRRLRRSRA